MDFLRLGSRSNFSGTDSPDGFVGDDDFGPGVGGDLRGNGGELPGYDRESFVGFALLNFGVGRVFSLWDE